MLLLDFDVAEDCENRLTELMSDEMGNRNMELPNKILLRKRAVVEFVNDFLKNICQIEHSRYRSCYNFVVNLISGIAAYSFLPKNSSIQLWNNAIPCRIL